MNNLGPDVAGAPVLGTPLSIDLAKLFKGMAEERFDFPIFGGRAGVYNLNDSSLIFIGNGKISVDRNILTKRGKLTNEEWAEIKKHPEVRYRIAQMVPELRIISEYIMCHHERWDGKGCPQGLAGENFC